MIESSDPLVVAITQAVGLVMERGLEVTPVGDGWFIRVAGADRKGMNADAYFGGRVTGLTS